MEKCIHYTKSQKSNIKDLRNYRLVRLLAATNKLFPKIITNRVSATLDSNQPRELAGFRSGCSTIDHIHVINQIVEKSAEYNLLLCMASIDYEKAFNIVKSSALSSR